jgi:hypothetical protein
MRVPLADGTLIVTPDVPAADMIPSLLALSDVIGTGWFAAHAANVKPGKTVAARLCQSNVRSGSSSPPRIRYSLRV